MGVTLVGTPTTATATAAGANTVSPAVPAGISAGLLLVAAHASQGNNATGYDGNALFTRRTPWTQQSADGRVLGVWTKVASGSEPGSYAFTCSHSDQRRLATMFALRGVDVSTPVDVVAADYDGTSITNGRSTASLTVPNGGLQLFIARAEFTAGNSSTPTSFPSGFTTLVSFQTGTGTTGSRSYLYVGYRTVGPGATGTSSIVWSGASPAAPSAQSIVVRAAPPKTGTFSGGFAFAGSFTGETPESGDPGEGAFAGGFAYAGSFAGQRAPVGTLAGGFAVAGSFTGARHPKGTLTGGFQFTGTFTGARQPVGAFDGGFAADGTFQGARTPVGQFTGSFAVDGAFAGTTDPIGTFEGAWGFAGSWWGGRLPRPWREVTATQRPQRDLARVVPQSGSFATPRPPRPIARR